MHESQYKVTKGNWTFGLNCSIFLPCKRCLFDIVNFIDILFHQQCLHAFGCNLQQPITDGSNTPFGQHILSHDFHTIFFYSTSFWFNFTEWITPHRPHTPQKYYNINATQWPKRVLCFVHSMRVQFSSYFLTLLETKFRSFGVWRVELKFSTQKQLKNTIFDLYFLVFLDETSMWNVLWCWMSNNTTTQFQWNRAHTEENIII